MCSVKALSVPQFSPITRIARDVDLFAFEFRSKIYLNLLARNR